MDDCPPAQRRIATPPFLCYLPVPCPGIFRGGRALLTRPVSLCRLAFCFSVWQEKRKGDMDQMEGKQEKMKQKMNYQC